VDKEYIEEALAALEQVDANAATALRHWIDAYYLFSDEPLAIRELILRAEERCKQLAFDAHELAVKFERLAMGCFDDAS
jgi:hypothetical protein